ncbi:MAG: flagellar basal body-associated FliL family protein [Actinomycetales bacterium]|nr:flagellar basal body-associated FliL family protein [Actinomycetales bacterium]
MPTETRVVSEKKKIGAKGGSSGDASVQEIPAKKGSKKKLLVILLVVVLVAAGAGYWFVLKPKAAAADGAATSQSAPAEPEQEPGTVMAIDSISINLAGGHYLRLGMALQLTADVKEDPDTARALDLAIALFSQQPLEEVSDEAKREALKAELLSELEEAYEGEVMGLYFTDFVTQ